MANSVTKQACSEYVQPLDIMYMAIVARIRHLVVKHPRITKNSARNYSREYRIETEKASLYSQKTPYSKVQSSNSLIIIIMYNYL